MPEHGIEDVFLATERFCLGLGALLIFRCLFQELIGKLDILSAALVSSVAVVPPGIDEIGELEVVVAICSGGCFAD